MTIGIAKPRRERDPKYLEWIRELPCIIHGNKCAVSESADPNHILQKGHGKTGSKCSDRRTLPFCRWHHDCYHAEGRVKFEIAYGIDLEAEIRRLNQLYDRTQAEPKKPRAKPTGVVIEIRCECGVKHRLKPSKVAISRFLLKGGWMRYWCVESRKYKEIEL